ncbi:MAG: S-methyl-5-thioribose-1-phosphate isomerase [Desulfobacterales bacterium GWB2_56_26]|nr:MAG: S-methyl-5-thioribose-1-phosphate isomerase [Desulfobacterales bacterium GWB2_56_26]
MRFNGIHYRTIWPDPQDNRQIRIIDQRQLPHEFVVETLTTLEETIIAIREMHVRGAGLIGATAGFGMYLAALAAPSDGFSEFMTAAGQRLDASRPTARNLLWAVERVLQAMTQSAEPEEQRRIAFATACAIADEDADFCRRIGEHGLAIIKEISRRKNGAPVNILTHCNAGWLAFVDYGSATAPIYAARDAGIPVHVWVDETRPWNQGTKLTAWELQQENIPNTLICDNTGGHIMQQSMVDMVIVGTDRTTHTGDVVNKIGTYLKALAAYDNNIPFYVALPSSTFDWRLDKGHDVPIEQREEEEITTLSGKDTDGKTRTLVLAAKGTRALNYSFDVTPARLITGLITERGIIKPEKEAIHRLFPEAGQHQDVIFQDRL